MAMNMNDGSHLPPNNRDDRKKEVQAAAVPDVPFQRFSSDHSQVLSTALEKLSHTQLPNTLRS